MTVDPRGADLKRLLDNDPGGPVVMLNLLRFAEGGREHYDRYSAAMAETILPRYGGKLIYVGDCSTPLVADGDAWEEEQWDVVMLVRYPSRQAFADMVADPECQRVAQWRTRALTDAVLQATTPWTGKG